MKIKLLLKLAVVLMDANETQSAYLILIKALGAANRSKAPTGQIMRAMNALRMHHEKVPFQRMAL